MNVMDTWEPTLGTGPLLGIAVAAIAVIAMKQFWPNKTAEEAAAKAETAKAAA